MESETIDATQLIEAVESLRQEVARLSERTTALEKLLPKETHEATAQLVEELKPGGLNEELIVAISAAIAAFLGCKPHIRQIRLLQRNPWAQQGRVTIQASHVLPIHHG